MGKGLCLHPKKYRFVLSHCLYSLGKTQTGLCRAETHLKNIPLLYKWWHEKVDVLFFVEMMPDTVSQCTCNRDKINNSGKLLENDNIRTNGVVEYEQILMLVLVKGED